MATLGRIASFVLSLVLLQGVSCQVFRFPEPAVEEEYCGTEVGKATWEVKGYVTVDRPFLKDCDHKVTIKAGHEQVCEIELDSCVEAFPEGATCSCIKDGSEYELLVRQDPKPEHSRLMLWASIASLDILNPGAVNADMSLLPVVYESIKWTWQHDPAVEALAVEDSQDLEVDDQPVWIEVCTENLLEHFTLSIEFGSTVTKTSHSPCVNVLMRPFDFNTDSAYTVTVKVEEHVGCKRTKTATITIMEEVVAV